MTLANIATVSFDPAKDGRAENVSVVEVGPEQAAPLNFKELEQARKDAVAAEDEFSKKKKDYQDENLDAINRVLKAEAGQPEAEGQGREIQAAWSKWREEQKDYSKKVSEARAKLNAERSVADLSVPDKDATAFDADRVHEGGEGVQAKVLSPNGESGNEAVRADAAARGPEGRRKTVEGRWMITGIKPLG